MQHQMIELECPSCQAVLELDAGFAGGVCRCSNCGTLMTVPADPFVSSSESLDRPDRPDTPGASAAFSVAVQESTTGEDDSFTDDRPETPGGTSSGSAVLDELVASTRPDTPTRPAPSESPGPDSAKPKQPKHKAPKSKDAAAKPGAGAKPSPKVVVVQPEVITTQRDEHGIETYVTASGTKLKLAANLIPTAKVKRKVVRGGVYLIAALLLGAVVAGTLVAVLSLSRLGTPPPDNQGVTTAGRGYDPNVNPFTDAGASFLGLPLSSHTVVLVDASSYTSRWIGTVLDAAAYTGRYTNSTGRVQFVFQSGATPHTFPEQPVALNKMPVAKLDAFLDSVRSTGSAEMVAVVQRALDAAPRQVILVTSQHLNDNARRSLSQLLDKHGSVRFDLVMINTSVTDHPQDLVDMVKAHKGELISLPSSRINTWLDAAEPLQRMDADDAGDAPDVTESADGGE